MSSESDCENVVIIAVSRTHRLTYIPANKPPDTNSFSPHPPSPRPLPQKHINNSNHETNQYNLRSPLPQPFSHPQPQHHLPTPNSNPPPTPLLHPHNPNPLPLPNHNPPHPLHRLRHHPPPLPRLPRILHPHKTLHPLRVRSRHFKPRYSLYPPTLPIPFRTAIYTANHVPAMDSSLRRLSPPRSPYS